jgi:predicted GTPase
MLTEHYAIVGHDLESCTAEVSMVRIDDVILVDTPGFDDTNKTDREILTMIADWLTNTYVYSLSGSFSFLFIRCTSDTNAKSS